MNIWRRASVAAHRVFLPALCALGMVAAPAAVNSSTTRPENPEAGVFVPNAGQWDDHVLFRARAGGMTIWIARDAVYYHLTRPAAAEVTGDAGDPHQQGRVAGSSEFSLVRARFVGANTTPQVTGTGHQRLRSHFFLGSDRSRWRTNVPAYSGVTLANVYPGIDARFRIDRTGLRHDWIIAPEADASRIRMQYDGMESLELSAAGELRARTRWGTLIGSDLNSDPSGGRYHLENDVEVSFVRTGAASDPATVIAPTISYSTFLGGTDFDVSYGMAVDTDGSVYLVGNSESADFPTENGFDETYNGGAFGDVVITKFTADGSALDYSTYIGGHAADIAGGIALDAEGNIYAAGITGSYGSFPLVGAYDSTYAGGGDGFVIKLGPDGDSLIYSTYLGGTGEDNIRAIAVDGAGCAYVTGRTKSADFPSTGAFDPDYNGGDYDAFVAKLSAAGNVLTYSSYLGGTADDAGYGIAVDTGGFAYVRGTTASEDFPVVNAYDATYNGGDRDVFVTKVSPAGDALVFSTYLGGSSSDYGIGIAVDDAGSVFLAGATRSADFPLRYAFDSTLGGLQDLFVTKLSPTGDALEYSTYLGGTGEDFSGQLALDRCGAVYVTGYTYSDDFPTLLALDDTYGAGADAIVAILTPAGDALRYSSFLGGAGFEFPNGIAVGADGHVYVAGVTNSPDFPVVNPYADTITGDYDAFLTKFGGFDAGNCGCHCTCHTDPLCDGVTNVLDVVKAVEVGFRNGPAITDPDPNCPRAATDADCDGDTDVLDVVRFVNVAFRNAPSADNFCEPCP